LEASGLLAAQSIWMAAGRVSVGLIGRGAKLPHCAWADCTATSGSNRALLLT
jgi:hypothetical protein